MKGLQEKFQVTLHKKEEAGEQWADFESQRVMAPSVNTEDTGKMNEMPVGYDMPCQKFTEAVGGSNDVSNKALGLNTPKAYKDGFAKSKMGMIDDQYTGEHADQFYADAGGFVERNNMLDRL